MTKITDVRVIRTRATGMWVIVKVLTDQPGLYGIGSASDVFHPETVMKAVETMAPMLIGREAGRIEDIWQSVYTSGYWRNGSILNTALAGIDMALWDIKGKEAGMPVYALLGGPCRAAVPAYAHAGGRDLDELEDSVRRYMAEGYAVIRCQLGAYGGGGFRDPATVSMPKQGWPMKRVFDDEAYLEAIPAMFEVLRDRLGFGIKLTHDVHEHLRPQVAVQLAKRLEPYRLFFVEDILPPEQVAWYRLIREQCATPQAIGELFVNPQEYVPLIADRLIDFIRVRVSKGGGITPCRKLAALGEWFGVHTAWQEGADNDPVNQMAACHLDMASWTFGIQEENDFRSEEKAVFPGHAVLEGGYLYPSDRPGLGIDLDEEAAAALLDPERMKRSFLHAEPDRKADGTAVRP
jgi:mannonate dehydratase